MNPDWAAVAVRALGFACLYQAAGAAFFIALFGRGLRDIHERICRLAVSAAVPGMALILMQAPLAAARMAGDYSGVTNGSLLHLAWHASSGIANAVQVAGLALIVVGLHGRRGNSVAAAVLGAVLAACAPVLTGHTSVNPQRALLAPLLAVHLLAVAFWFGALAPLWLAIAHEAPADAARLLRRFSALAAWLVPCIALAGLAMAFLLIDHLAVLRRPYGLLLLVKLCLFALLMVLAAVNRWHFTPALEAAVPARRSLQRSIVTEYLLITAALVATAVLTTLYSPDD
ncbi:MAG TPA: CopD family protein [Steroidobacteraceae bacterium]